MVKATAIEGISALLYERKNMRIILGKVVRGIAELDNPEKDGLSALAAGRSIKVETFAERMYFHDTDSIRSVLFAAQQGLERGIAAKTAALAAAGIEDDDNANP